MLLRFKVYYFIVHWLLPKFSHWSLPSHFRHSTRKKRRKSVLSLQKMASEGQASWVRKEGQTWRFRTKLQNWDSYLCTCGTACLVNWILYWQLHGIASGALKFLWWEQSTQTGTGLKPTTYFTGLDGKKTRWMSPYISSLYNKILSPNGKCWATEPLVFC